MSEYESIISAVTVMPKNDKLYSEMATKISLDDEAAGLFVVIEQERADGKENKITLDEEEWPAVRNAIDTFMAVCAQRNKEQV